VLALMSRMNELIKLNSQFVIAMHSPIILAYPDAKIFLLGDGGVTETTYEDLEHVQVTRNFSIGADFPRPPPSQRRRNLRRKEPFVCAV
jgi:predicted ATPase